MRQQLQNLCVGAVSSSAIICRHYTIARSQLTGPAVSGLVLPSGPDNQLIFNNPIFELCSLQ